MNISKNFVYYIWQKHIHHSFVLVRIQLFNTESTVQKYNIRHTWELIVFKNKLF